MMGRVVSPSPPRPPVRGDKLRKMNMAEWLLDVTKQDTEAGMQFPAACDAMTMEEAWEETTYPRLMLWMLQRMPSAPARVYQVLHFGLACADKAVAAEMAAGRDPVTVEMRALALVRGAVHGDDVRVDQLEEADGDMVRMVRDVSHALDPTRHGKGLFDDGYLHDTERRLLCVQAERLVLGAALKLAYYTRYGRAESPLGLAMYGKGRLLNECYEWVSQASVAAAACVAQDPQGMDREQHMQNEALRELVLDPFLDFDFYKSGGIDWGVGPDRTGVHIHTVDTQEEDDGRQQDEEPERATDSDGSDEGGRGED